MSSCGKQSECFKSHDTPLSCRRPNYSNPEPFAQRPYDTLRSPYVNDFATISTNIAIKGVGGMGNFVATVPPPDGKGILVTQSDVTIQNLSFSGVAVGDGNGAGIRYEGGNLVVIDSYFHDNQMNLLAANPVPTGTIRI